MKRELKVKNVLRLGETSIHLWADERHSLSQECRMLGTMAQGHVLLGLPMEPQQAPSWIHNVWVVL